MTPANLTAAAALLDQAATLLAGDPLALNAHHLARACQLRARVEAATVHVELPGRVAIPITVRQTGTVVQMIHQETGERREVDLLTFTRAGDTWKAWRAAE